jgi:putative transcriptional regulator
LTAQSGKPVNGQGLDLKRETVGSEARGEAVDALLAAYGAGSLDPSLHALVASHLILKPQSRRFVAALEDLAADELTQMAPQPLSRRDERLAAIFGTDPAPRKAAPGAGTDILPSPLRHYLGRGLNDIHWRTKLPGVKEFRFEEKGRGDASLLWVRAGRRMPSHTHEGSEVTLVLQGGVSDVTGHYGRGDIAIADADLDHKPVSDEGEDCLCFAVTDAPLHLTGPFGRVLDRLFGDKR